MSSTEMKSQQEFTLEFTVRAVKLDLGGHVVATAARELGIATSLLHH